MGRHCREDFHLAANVRQIQVFIHGMGALAGPG